MSSGAQARVFELYTEAQDIKLLGAKTGAHPGSLKSTAYNIDTDRVWEALRAIQVLEVIKSCFFFEPLLVWKLM